ncbi:MAG: type II asparaginase, partial [Burkholderiaceae bacterium]|nr:type II asparaginase [Burkholderiaceae bacterium]
NEVLADDSVTGVVVTHGTDTLEETAYFLNLTVKSVKPVIVVGAMRPSTAISADGPVNLLNAVRLAVDPVAIDRGVMIVLNDEINGARDCTKTNTTNLATFKAPEAGLLGYIAGGRHYFIKKTAMHHTVHTEFDVRHLDVLPRVDIVYSYINADGIMVRAAMAAGAKGIVHAGSGNGSVHDDTLGALFDARDHGVAVVRSSRVGNGVVTEDCEEWTEAGLLDAATLNPQKSRILLQLGLTITDDPIQLQRMFYEY